MSNQTPAAQLGFLGRYFGTIRGKLIVFTVCLFVLFIWALTYLSVTVLQDRFDQVLLEQQLASTQRVAAELDGKLKERINFLSSAAELVPADLGPRSLDAYLFQRTGLHVLFSAGIAVIGLDGITIADYPAVPGRRGTFFGDRDYFKRVVATGRPYVDKPIMGRALNRPVLTIAVPVFDSAGKMRAVMTGVTDLSTSSFLGSITSGALAGPGEYFILSRQDRVIVAATDARRAMSPVSERGRNSILDRFLDGFEGSGFGINSGGIAKLYSGKLVPVADWVVLAALPADIARKPVKDMQIYLYAGATIITFFAILVLYWMTRRVLAPLEETGATIRRMTAGDIPLAPVPVGPQDEVGQLIDDFNRLVRERQRYEARLETSSRQLHAFTYAASHDMKAPLGRINTFSDLLERDYRDRLEGNGLLFLDLIRRNTRRLMALVEGLLVHAEFGQRSFTLSAVSLLRAVDGVLRDFREDACQAGVELRICLEDITVLAAQHALGQVMRNLLDNALKYSKDVKAPFIEVGSQVNGDQCVIWVRDNGVGFDMIYHDQIFEVLQRLHTYEEFPGSGIGLALVKRAMECMGGKVWAESEPGQGATFYLQLQVVNQTAGSKSGLPETR